MLVKLNSIQPARDELKAAVLKANVSMHTVSGMDAGLVRLNAAIELNRKLELFAVIPAAERVRDELMLVKKTYVAVKAAIMQGQLALKAEEGEEAAIAELNTAIENAGRLEVYGLEKNVSVLATISGAAPMIGFLGTVIGMIKAFNVISLSGTGNPGLVASGISEALITTAAGMLVGIPALVLYHYFRGKIDRYVFEMEEVAIQLVEELSYDGVVKEKSSGKPKKPASASK